jgi:hypothetical protein
VKHYGLFSPEHFDRQSFVVEQEKRARPFCVLGGVTGRRQAADRRPWQAVDLRRGRAAVSRGATCPRHECG